jgi:excisionase family DNA binding protein
MTNIILSGITVDDLLLRIEQMMEAKLNAPLQQKAKDKTEYITRKEVAAILKVTLPTLHEWTKLGWLPSYKMGSRVLYKKAEVEKAIDNVQAYKHKKGGRP